MRTKAPTGKIFRYKKDFIRAKNHLFHQHQHNVDDEALQVGPT